MAPPLSAGFITISLLFFSFSRARVSALERLLHELGVGACSNISVVVTLMKVSRVGDLPSGGVHPVGFENWSYVVEFDSPKWNFNRSLLLNRRVSL